MGGDRMCALVATGGVSEVLATQVHRDGFSHLRPGEGLPIISLTPRNRATGLLNFFRILPHPVEDKIMSDLFGGTARKGW